MSDASKREEKQKWAIEKTKLDNARRLHGIYFIDSEDVEFIHVDNNDTIKHAVHTCTVAFSTQS